MTPEIDKEFIAKMLFKYRKHLEGTAKHAHSNVETYTRQISSLGRIDDARYRDYIKELQSKLSHSLTVLENVEPNIKKIREQCELLVPNSYKDNEEEI